MPYDTTHLFSEESKQKARSQPPGAEGFKSWLIFHGYADSTVRQYVKLAEVAQRNTTVTDDTAWAEYMQRYSMASQIVRNAVRNLLLIYRHCFGDSTVPTWVEPVVAATPQAGNGVMPTPADRRAFECYLEDTGVSANTAGQYASRLWSFLRWAHKNPDLGFMDYRKEHSLIAVGAVQTNWHHLQAFLATRGYDVEDLTPKLPEAIHAAVCVLLVEVGDSVRQSTWADVEEVQDRLGDVRIFKLAGHERSAKESAALHALREWVETAADDYPVIPVTQDSKVPMSRFVARHHLRTKPEPSAIADLLVAFRRRRSPNHSRSSPRLPPDQPVPSSQRH